MIIVITGTPGTGKTEVAKAVAKKLGYTVINEKDFCKQHHIGKITHDELVIPLSTLKKALDIEIYNKKDIVVEGHMLSDIRIGADLIIVLRTNPKVLEKRLKKRGYSKTKTSDNIMAEILDYCTIHTEHKYAKDKIFEVDTSSKTVDETATTILKIIAGEHKGHNVNWNTNISLVLAKDINKKLNE